MGRLKMINPNKNTNEEVLRRLKDGSYERMRVELKNSIESKMQDFDMSWNDLGIQLGLTPEFIGKLSSPGDVARWEIVYNDQMTLEELNAVAHIFSCEPYILFRPREPWINT